VVQAVAAGQSAVSIVYKEFGVKLQFTPTIIDENHIRLELEPEVSSLDTTAAIRISGFTIPGLRVRRAKTTLELRDGQSFALAGLIDNTEQVNISKFPLLGDIPLLGELFKSRSFRRNETELLFLATVKIVEPLNPDQLPRLPGVSELKPMQSGSFSSSPSMSPASSIEGQSGHSVPRRPEDAPVAQPAAKPAGQSVTPPAAAPAPNVKPNPSGKSASIGLTSAVIGPVGSAPSEEKGSPVKPE
jgi:pilus assembly protein CpaC